MYLLTSIIRYICKRIYIVRETNYYNQIDIFAAWQVYVSIVDCILYSQQTRRKGGDEGKNRRRSNRDRRRTTC